MAALTRWRAGWALLVLLALLLPPSQSRAQVVSDGSTGTEPAGLLPGGIDDQGQAATYLITEDYGDRRGNNLFHSFDRFDIRMSETATFTGPAAIENVIGRVTGGFRSQIDGRLRSTIPGADVYLLNPAGIVFGKHSSLDIKGSFHASTAESLEFSSGETLITGEKTPLPLVDFGSPTQFGFLGNQDASVVVDGKTLFANQVGGISFHAGTVELKNGGSVGTLAFGDGPGGAIEIVAAHEIRMSGVNAAGGAPKVSTSTFGNGRAGSILLEAPSIRMGDGADVWTVGSGFGSGGSGDITIRASQELQLSGREVGSAPTAVGASIATTVPGAGDGGRILIETPILRLDEGAGIFSEVEAASTGAGGNIRIESSESLLLTGTASPGGISPIVLARTQGDGHGGRLDIVAAAGENIVIDQVTVGSEVNGKGSSGAVAIAAPGGRVTVHGSRTPDVNVALIASTLAEGNAGGLSIRSKEILLDGAAIFSNPLDIIDGEVATGNGGNIVLIAESSIELSGRDADGFGSVIGSSSEGDGRAGNIVLAAPEIRIRDGAKILAESFGEGSAGAISIRTDGTGEVGDIRIESSRISTSTAANGAAQDIELVGSSIVLRDTEISSQTFGDRPGGNIVLDGREIIHLHNSDVRADSFLGPGDSGSVRLRAPVINVVEDSSVSANAAAPGARPGQIELIADERIVLGEGGGVLGATILAISDVTGSDGDPEGAASILLEAPVVRLEDGAIINSDSLSDGLGVAGNITIIASEELSLSGRGGSEANPHPSSITSRNGGGAIDLRTARLTLEDGATLSTRTSAGADGGSIRLDVGTLRMSDASTIKASTRGTGNAGDITIGPADGEHVTRRVKLSGESTITTSSELPVSGVPLPGAGSAGRVSMNVHGEVDLRDSSIISLSETAGEAGSIETTINGSLRLDNSRLSTTALDSGGGDILLGVSERLILEHGSEVTASVAAGTGGTIRIAEPEVVVLRDASSIVAQAALEPGTGGSIEISTDALFVSPDSEIDASAPGGPDVQGSVNIDTPDVKIDSQITPLATDFLDPSQLLQPACMAQQRSTGSFAVAQRGAMPASPEDLLLVFDPIVRSDQQLASQGDGANPIVPNQDDPIQIAQADASQGAMAFRGGHFTEAEAHWSEASEAYAAIGDQAARIEALRGLAQTQQAQGRYARSVATLQTALDAARESGSDTQMAFVLGSLGNAHLALGQTEAAAAHLQQGVDLARQSGNPALASTLLNNYGNHLAVSGDADSALEAYREAAGLAADAGQPANEAKALSNGARVALDGDEFDMASRLLSRGQSKTRTLPDTHEKVFLLIHLAKSQEALAAASPTHHRESLLSAHQALSVSSELSRSVGDDRSLSYSLGNQAALYQSEHRYEEALYITRQALAKAQSARAPDAEYRWYWQAGQILWAQGRAREAVDSYRRSVEIIEETRQETLARYDSGETNFRRRVAPVYLDLIDALLQSADRVGEEVTSTPLLLEARNTMERFKAAELRNYFRDECVADLEARKKTLDETLARAGNAAVVYPLLLPDRTELLVSLPSGLRRYAVEIGREQITETANLFRREIQLRRARRYLEPAGQLYDWLVAPYESDLREAEVDILVFVPEGVLRTTPLAALHDGQGFLIERYAVAVTPGLSLMDPEPLRHQRERPLLAGVSESVQGFEALPAVPAELEAVKELYGGNVLLDADFTSDLLESSLGESNPGIVHLATHAVFTGDPRTSFLLTHDDRLTMDHLSEIVGQTRFRTNPLELLVLSACETAAGNERAGLGLAGIAIRAGARSAVGSLWTISDEATRELIVEFYRQLKQPGVSKGVALQRAQAKLLADPRFSHPFYWSQFLLINNWL